MGFEIIAINEKNLDKEHICCAISDRKNDPCVAAKKDWMRQRFADGLVFRRLDARGKVFMETIPAGKAWCPIRADGYLFINCFWVSGQFKGQGWGNKLLAEAVGDAQGQGMKGLVALSSRKKLPFLSDPGYLKHKGFQVCDSAAPYYELLYLPFHEGCEKPAFKDCCKKGTIPDTGMVLYYSHQCPHTAKYAPLIQAMAEAAGRRLELIRFDTREQAREAPAPFTTYSFFDNGRFVTNEIFSEGKFGKYLAGKGL